MVDTLGEGTLTTTSDYQEVLKVECPTFITWTRVTFQLYEGNLSTDGATLTGVNNVKYKVQGSDVEAAALWQDLPVNGTEFALTAGTVDSQEVSQQFRFVRVVAKDAVNGTHGKINVNACGF